MIVNPATPELETMLRLSGHFSRYFVKLQKRNFTK